MNEADLPSTRRVHDISVVVPVYMGETTLESLVGEIETLTSLTQTDDGNWFEIRELFLVWDNGPDKSDDVIRLMASKHSWVKPIWLSRNFGQHAATLAGMSSTSGSWIVTLDEDGQHNPANIAEMLDTALRNQSQVIYASPKNSPPHGRFRNGASRTAKWILGHVLMPGFEFRFNSFRLILGELGRSTAAYCGPDVYLDIAVGWVAERISYCELNLRSEGRESGYSRKSLFGHFWRMVISSGTRPLRLVTIAGFVAAIIGFGLAITLAMRRLISQIPVQGWASLSVIMLVIGGITIGSLGIIAEYVGVAVKMAMGKPLYLIVRDPKSGPLNNTDK